MGVILNEVYQAASIAHIGTFLVSFGVVCSMEEVFFSAFPRSHRVPCEFKMKEESKVDLRWPFRIIALMAGFSFLIFLVTDFEGSIDHEESIFRRVVRVIFAYAMLHGGLTGRVPKWIKKVLGWG